ncbi:hypothetical protein [Polaromonas sp.]|uniref:hypothetical protein n=1 Tax=Polaromonas sp. TaxID=1869339 RepID=UPI003BB5CCEA
MKNNERGGFSRLFHSTIRTGSAQTSSALNNSYTAHVSPMAMYAGSTSRSYSSSLSKPNAIAAARGEKAILDGDGDLLGKANANETRGSDGVACTDQPHSLLGRHDLCVGSGRRVDAVVFLLLHNVLR